MSMQLKQRIVAPHPDAPIVMVDDEPLDIEAARRGLQKSVLSNPFLSFPDGEPFLDFLADVRAGRQRYPAIVLLDVNMPRMSGFEVLQAMRTNPAFESIPVVSMLTSSTHEQDRQSALMAGANDYLIKPHDYNDYTALFNSMVD